jgi:hypothetical protein
MTILWSRLRVKPQLLYADNQSAIAIIKNPGFNERTKHIDTKYHFVRDAYKNGKLQLEYIPTADMTADILTKALPREAHWRHVKGMGLSQSGNGN